VVSMFRTLTPRQLAFDITLGTVCWLARAAISVNEPQMYLISLAMAAALALRRVNPSFALAIAWAGALLQVGTGVNPDVSNVAILPVLYATAAYGSPVVKWLGLASGGAGAVIVALYLWLPDVIRLSQCLVRPGDACVAGNELSNRVLVLGVAFFSFLAVFVLSWTLGLLAKTWHNARESALAKVIAERQRIDAQQAVMVEQERSRIARDMHDVVAHSLAVVIAQADGARYARKENPDAVDAALVTIASTAREALSDVLVLLGRLRHSQDEAPQPVLADLDRLFDQLRSSGLRIAVVQEGDRIQLVAGQQLVVYRIVQEALTNALRHGDVTEDVRVRLEWAAEAITVSVRNRVAVESADVNTEWSGAGSSTVGHGLAGMRERATLWGGSFSAGATGDGGYLVTATLPIRVRSEGDS
jgi:signal transduction histidine kinase